MKNGAQAVIEALERHHVRHVFGYPGGAVVPLYDALSHSSIQHILVRQEQGAVHGASGYARSSGEAGVVIATSGPGATNLVTGIAAAAMDSIPLILITGQVETFQIGTDAFQEVDITGITEPISKHNYLVKNADDLPEIMEEAFHIATTGRPGPVLIDLPKDVALAPCHGEPPKQLNLAGYQPTVKGSSKQIKSAVAIMSEAARPLIYAGGGVIRSHAEDALRALAEKWDAPVVSTLMGIGSIDSDHPLYRGMTGLHGHPAANRLFCNADVILAAGTRFDDRVTRNYRGFGDNAKIIHIDIDPAEIGKNILSRVPIVGDIDRVATELVAALPQGKHADWAGEANFRCDMPYVFSKHLAAPLLFELLNELTARDCIYTTDVGQHQLYAAQYLDVAAGPHLLSCGGLGAMGYGLPAAIGAKLACPDKQVVAITGDGSFQMNMNELATVAEQQLDLVVLLLNNNCLGLVRQQQHFYCKKNYFGVDLPGNPDFALIAAAYGAQYLRIDSADTAGATLRDALGRRGIVLVECLLPKDDLVLPMVLSGQPLENMLMEASDD